MIEDEIIKKLNKMGSEAIDDAVADMELSLENGDLAEINAEASKYLERKEVCSLLHIPYSEADQHFAKLQLYAYYLKQEDKI